MIIRNLILISTMFLLFTLPSWASNHMITKHLFSPKPVLDNSSIINTKKSPGAEKLAKDLDFTGVLLIKNERMVLIRDKKKKELKTVFRVGDKIRSVIIEEIGVNYMVLADNNEKIRLNLYRDKKNRPTAPPVSVQPSAKSPFAQIQANNQAVINSKANTGNNKSKKAVSPDIINSIKKSRNSTPNVVNPKNINPKKVSNSKTPSANSFVEAIEKSQKRIQENPEAYKHLRHLLYP